MLSTASGVKNNFKMYTKIGSKVVDAIFIIMLTWKG